MRSARLKRALGKGGISLFEKEISLPLDPPRENCIAGLQLEGVQRLGNGRALRGGIASLAAMGVRDDLVYFYYPLPLCVSSVGAA